MQGRLDRLQDRAAKRRQIAKDAMVELDLKKLTAPDFTASITARNARPGGAQRGCRAEDLLGAGRAPAATPGPGERPQRGRRGRWRHPLQSGTGFEREDTVMGFSAKQVQALRRNLDHRHVRTREAHGRELSYLEGWYAISEANRIFGFDGWNRETIESKCVLARENRGTFLAVYIARVRVTVHADGATIIREGHGTGEGRGTSPGEVHDIALKAAETDATKRALATFGKPFGLELYRGGKTAASQKPLPSPPSCRPCPPTPVSASIRTTRPLSHGRPATMAAARIWSRGIGRRGDVNWKSGQSIGTSIVPVSPGLVPGPDRQERSHHRRAQTAARQSASEVRGLAALSRLRPAAVRSASSAVCPTQSPRSQSQRRVHRSRSAAVITGSCIRPAMR